MIYLGGTIFIEYGISVKVDGLIKMCLNETCNKVRICKRLSTFPI
jgi:hypothetical protein